MALERPPCTPTSFAETASARFRQTNQEAHPLPKGRPHTCAGSLKGGRADWLVEKCTELGASALQPLLTERSPSVGERIERWERVTLAATKQCQRLHEMRLREPLTVQQLLPIVSKAVRLVFWSFRVRLQNVLWSRRAVVRSSRRAVLLFWSCKTA
jgi:RsmE family RNA methyltransferase